MKITIYTSPHCMPCLGTKRALTRYEVPFTEVDVTSAPDAADPILEPSDMARAVHRRPGEAMTDIISAFAEIKRQSSIEYDAYRFTQIPYLSLLNPEDAPEWTPPTDEELEAHLLKSWDRQAVGMFFAKRAQREAERLARERWEATLRGRVTLRCRKVRGEVRDRVPTAWNVLRHGTDEYGSE
ncbi:glutaredoxin family protein [Rhodococcus sp. 1168]|uniref:glutaredoxin family protein n=1 Tax=Rhodococcus sp. 1168 TaxID=2018041 RepID=UPI000A0DE954|nr:glutaredoxin family protein [Rhodococcus sp. 1168]ORI13459.1 hypothetical protein BJI47_22715 [Rhodococcus sp. 1168]